MKTLGIYKLNKSNQIWYCLLSTFPRSHPKDRSSQNYLELETNNHFHFHFSSVSLLLCSLGRCPFQSQRAGERCLTSTQRPRAPGESRPPRLPWLTTALQRGASRPAAAVDGGTPLRSRQWRSGEPAPPLPPQPCANQVSPTRGLTSGSGYFLERYTSCRILRIQSLGQFPHFICTLRLTYLLCRVYGHRGAPNRSPCSPLRKKKNWLPESRPHHVCAGYPE